MIDPQIIPAAKDVSNAADSLQLTEPKKSKKAVVSEIVSLAKPALPPEQELDGYFPFGKEILADRAFAKLFLHYGEKETGPNMGPVVGWAMQPWSKTKPDETGWAAWCAAAVCTAYLEAGSKQMQEIGSTNANTLWHHLIKLGQASPPSDSMAPRLGDLVFFEHLGNVYHVGLVKEYQPNTKTLITLEGNSNDTIRLCKRTSYHGFAFIKE